MTVFGPIGFTAPWLLLGLSALPVLWFLLRAVPPAPIRRRFPGVALLLGLADEEVQAERTPWWLLALRMLALAAAIVGFAGPVLNPVVSVPGQGPLLIVEDGSWASARDWSRRVARMKEALSEAEGAGRPAAILMLSDPPPGPQPFAAPGDLVPGLAGLKPAPWEPGADVPPLPDGRFETLWLSDGLARPGREALADALRAHGALRVWQPAVPVLALGAARIVEAEVHVPALASAPVPFPVEVTAVGLDPAGIERELARQEISLSAATRAEAIFDLPPELRNRVTRFEVTALRSAGSVSLTDDAVKRRKVALIGGAPTREGLALLSPLHYLQQALAPSADLLEGTLDDILIAKPDVIVLADVATLAEPDRLAEWVEEGGLLLRFAGPRMAAAESGDDPLLPVRLRAGGRSVGGTMSWGEPRQLAPFPEASPFFGLTPPDDVTVRAQVMAEPGPELAERTIAALADGTPLVTRARFGQGEVVLFHVSANAEWSSLPLSGLFPQMLERLAISARPAQPGQAELAGTTWRAVKLIDAFGRLEGAEARSGIPGEDLGEALAGAGAGPALPPGLYAAEDRSVALNALAPGRELSPALWPLDVPVEGGEAPRAMPLKGWLVLAALGLLALDILAALAVSGRLRGPRVARAMVVLLALGLGMMPGTGLRAEETTMDPERAIAAASNVVLAHMPTGDPEVDRIALAGLQGLSDTLFARTAVEPSEPMTLDIERDDLALFTLIYWPVTADQPAPSPQAYARLNRYLRGGGMILFDTRDADLLGVGSASPAARRLQALAAPLDIPPLEPVPSDHVLTRTFYLLQTFPGRYDGPIWVEAAPPDAERAEGMPFRNLNDGVTPLVIGGNDWAAAWAEDARGLPMFPIGRGSAGDRQREIALRFGVNLVMHVLTGNYKSDQVHVPALLERLGQ
ncbi:DUF4159 domain-containing protein [Sinirhodobacter sp. WL0062]|uniref:DUF4159 domain-containing protein n=1 Tax=Rhodobacter flavimaris TaxID=2907145 RepID=A0ABS8Z0K2_9RHOB|nr:DUF4159 domain-containing protein [Sinirhodobacter sp. WL0062]MCE5973475.1 DUF4159 domain-containing protein [Sinirhodobacter sp. WL0062]